MLFNFATVSKLAFSASLLDSGEGNTDNQVFAPLIYKNVFTNIGNHYNPNTGETDSLIEWLIDFNNFTLSVIVTVFFLLVFQVTSLHR